ncbi:MAG: nucleoside deaminase [Desulfamplus sp.]|nr:nucleoside deaminase [Desulfamplus sp.]
MDLSKDEKYMKLAIAEANRAFEQGEFPVGCVIIFNDTIVASGSRLGTTSSEKYPSEIYHAEIRALQSFENSISDGMRDEYNGINNYETIAVCGEIGKISRTNIMAEKGALINRAKIVPEKGSLINRAKIVPEKGALINRAKIVPEKGSLISSSKIMPEQCTLYCTMEPCLMCFGAIILSGIKKIVYSFEDPMGGGTSCDLKSLSPLYRDSGIKITPHVLRYKSLELFARFFSKEDNLYWKDSLLEKYTLEEMVKTQGFKRA